MDIEALWSRAEDLANVPEGVLGDTSGCSRTGGGRAVLLEKSYPGRVQPVSVMQLLVCSGLVKCTLTDLVIPDLHILGSDSRERERGVTAERKGGGSSREGGVAAERGGVAAEREG